MLQWQIALCKRNRCNSWCPKRMSMDDISLPARQVRANGGQLAFPCHSRRRLYEGWSKMRPRGPLLKGHDQAVTPADSRTRDRQTATTTTVPTAPANASVGGPPPPVPRNLPPASLTGRFCLSRHWINDTWLQKGDGHNELSGQTSGRSQRVIAFGSRDK